MINIAMNNEIKGSVYAKKDGKFKKLRIRTMAVTKGNDNTDKYIELDVHPELTDDGLMIPMNINSNPDKQFYICIDNNLLDEITKRIKNREGDDCE